MRLSSKGRRRSEIACRALPRLLGIVVILLYLAPWCYTGVWLARPAFPMLGLELAERVLKAVGRAFTTSSVEAWTPEGFYTRSLLFLTLAPAGAGLALLLSPRARTGRLALFMSIIALAAAVSLLLVLERGFATAGVLEVTPRAFVRLAPLALAGAMVALALACPGSMRAVVAVAVSAGVIAAGFVGRADDMDDEFLGWGPRAVAFALSAATLVEALAYRPASEDSAPEVQEAPSAREGPAAAA